MKFANFVKQENKNLFNYGGVVIMATSTKKQNEKFYDFMSELNGFWHGNADVRNFIDRIEEAFENDEISTSQYDKLIRESEDFL